MGEFRDIFAKADADILDRVGDLATLDGVSVRGELSTDPDQAGFGGRMSGIQGLSYLLPDAMAAQAERGSVLVDVVGGVTYDVVEVVPQGDGLTALSLRIPPPVMPSQENP
jgi:hypothetical protein